MDKRLADDLPRGPFFSINNARSASFGICDNGAGALSATITSTVRGADGGNLQEAIGSHLSLLAELVSAEGWSDARAVANSLICRFGGLVYPRLADSKLRGSRPSSFSEIVDVFNDYFKNINIERLVVGYTDATERLFAIEVIASGSTEAVCAEARKLFSSALCLDARGIILAHNHPSGDPTPSSADIKTTKYIKSLAEKLEIELVDHLIFGAKDPYSIRKGGFL